MCLGFSHRHWPAKILDACRPEDSRIPFFRNAEEYGQRPHPDFPPGDGPNRICVWLVEPGVQSLEVYEAILAETLYQRQRFRRLRKYVSVAGLVQDRRSRHCTSIRPEDNCRRRAPRDVCYTLMTVAESRAVSNWLWMRETAEGECDDTSCSAVGLRVAKCAHVATPLGPVMLARCNNPEARHDACMDLGFADGEAAWQFPRSKLPQGMLMMGCAGVQAWALPAEDGTGDDGTALRDTEDVVRVEWHRVERPQDDWWSTDENAEWVNDHY
ncbi:hypothetical protein PWT90_07843 [Aphanocladium album]|nr:hypothetical protein PWT90_07843 [Aphanocladium album]